MRRAVLLLLAVALGACSDTDAPPTLRDIAAEADTSAFAAAPIPDDAAAVFDTLAVPTIPFETVTPDAPPDPVRPAATRPPAPPPAPVETPDPVPADGRYAVLVGIDDYPGDDDDLPSGNLDVDAMRTLLIDRFGFLPEHVLTLRDRAATRGAIRRAVAEHLGQATGTALFYFSGHGVRLDVNAGRADDEADGRDEAVYVWADGAEKGALVLDDELGAWVGALDAARVVSILDACHSGTGTRATGDTPPVKEVAYASVADDLDPDAPWDTRETASADSTVSPTSASAVDARPTARNVLLAAAADREQALAGHPGNPSVFTATLTAVLRAAPRDRSLADAMREITARVRTASRNYGLEHTPQTERVGTLTLADLLGR